MKFKELIVLLLLVVALSSRFLFLIDGGSVLPNFTAIGAMAILAAVYLKGAKKWIFPLLLVWGSDIILNNVIYTKYFTSFQLFGDLWVYFSIAIIGVVAYFIMKKPSWIKLGATSILAAILFFMLTNFGVWLSMASPYSKDMSGLLQCYEAGIPFFRNTLISNVLYSYLLFGIYEFIASRTESLTPQLSNA